MSDYQLEDTLYLPFTTRAFATGIPTALVSGAVDIYEDVTATPIITGETLSVSLNSVAGFNMVTVAATSGTGFEAGKSYTAILQAGTVDSVSVVGEVVAHFTLDKSAAAKDLANGTDGLGAIKAETANILTDTGTTIPGTITTVQNDLDIITDADGVILGAAGVDLIWDEVINGANHNTTNTSGRRLRELRESGFYSDGFVYIDTVNGAADTTSYEAGTEVNPTNTIARANTIATAIGLSKFKVIPGSSITFAATQANQVFEGDAWTLALGGQNIDGTTIKGATVTGIATNTSDDQFFSRCLLGAVTIPGDTHLIGCGLGGTITFGQPGDYFIDDCHSAIAGAGAVTVDFGSPATETNLSVRHHSGGWTVANMGAGAGTCNASFEGNGQITWAASCVATSNASIRGNWKITDSASGAVTETLDDNQTAVDEIGTAGAGLTNINLPNQTMDIVGDITGNLSGSVGSLTGHTNQTGDTYALANGAAGFVAIDTVVDAIQVVTDKFVFTVANQVDSNIQYVNDVALVGDGSGTPFNV